MKNEVRSLIAKYKSKKVKQQVREKVDRKVGQLTITKSGFSKVNGDYFPYIKLKNGHKFYGYNTPHGLFIEYHCLEEEVKKHLVKEAYFVALDYYRSYIQTSQFDQEKHYKVAPGDTVVQIGAYHGHYTTKLSHSAGSNGKVVAIEAHPINYKIMKKNIEENCLNNVITINKTISNKVNKHADFYVTDRVGGKSYRVNNKFKRKDKFKISKIKNLLSELGFSILAIGGDGSIILNHQYKIDSFYKEKYYGMDGVMEILAKK